MTNHDSEFPSTWANGLCERTKFKNYVLAVRECQNIMRDTPHQKYSINYFCVLTIHYGLKSNVPNDRDSAYKYRVRYSAHDAF